ncbi:MAG TPA: DUF1667 domain-containing protein [Lachnospiraceae bacterium]|nr:DUF1667 domain-containing protein [Lachnospiraceae bacterium]
MIKKDMSCIRCPLGCAMTVVLSDEGTVTVTGNTCERGAEYGSNELTDPKRTVTTTLRVVGRKDCMLPVKTATDIPKDKIFDCMEALKNIEVTTPIQIGDIVLKNVAGTGASVVATKTI